jgi:hypothetical protein
MAPNETTPRSKRSRSTAVAATGASWLALVAATTLGLGHVARVRTEISAEPGSVVGPESYRLIVQSYAPKSVGDDQRPAVHARPLASTQRAITAEELQNGIAVDIVQLGEEQGGSEVVVAWIELGAPDLEFDAMRARPAQDAFYGVGHGGERVVLKRRA